MPKKYKRLSEYRKIPMPEEGNETDAEIGASIKGERVDFLRAKANSHASNAKVVEARAKDGRNMEGKELTIQDNRETAQAYKAHADVLDRLTALQTNGANDQGHKLHNDYMQVLQEYRASRQKLKTYGRWGATFL